MTLDEAWTPRVFDVEGMTVAFFAFTELLNDRTKDEAPPHKPHVAMFDVKRLDRAIANVRRELGRLAMAPDPARKQELRDWESLYLLRRMSIRSVLGERFIREIGTTPPDATAVPVPIAAPLDVTAP